MAQYEHEIHFRKTFYFKMLLVTVFLGVVFVGALFWIYKMSCRRFEEELSYHSDVLTEQICRNVDVSLKELSEKTVPLTAVNERLGPILSKTEQKEEDVFLGLRVRNQLEELLGMNYDLNWISVVDDRDQVYVSSRDVREVWNVPDQQQIQELYNLNEAELENRPGNTVWIKSRDADGIILMRSIFDFDSMRFCGTVIAEVKNTRIKDIFEHIDSRKAGYFILYDKNKDVIFSTWNPEYSQGMEWGEDYIRAQYPIGRGRLTMLHILDLQEKNQRFSDLLYVIAGIGFFVFFLIILFLWLMFGKMAKKLKLLRKNLYMVSQGQFELETPFWAKGDELDVLAGSIQEMSGKIKELMEQVVKDEEIQQQNRYKLLELRYHELQSQVNPHFLFNILQSINGIAQINKDWQVSRLICMLSKFFRGNIDRRYTDCMLKEELEYARNYLELYQNIYPDRLSIQWDTDPALSEVKVPTYILQPIVENSLVHGMEPVVGLCTICIRVSRERDGILISVKDDGAGIPPEQLEVLRKGNGSSRRIGIRNVQDRIQILYGKQYGVSIESEQGIYTEVRIRLPLP